MRSGSSFAPYINHSQLKDENQIVQEYTFLGEGGVKGEYGGTMGDERALTSNVNPPPSLNVLLSGVNFSDVCS